MASNDASRTLGLHLLLRRAIIRYGSVNPSTPGGRGMRSVVITGTSTGIDWGAAKVLIAARHGAPPDEICP
jgi:hypothetical protein